jgi:hypothetical protein
MTAFDSVFFGCSTALLLMFKIITRVSLQQLRYQEMHPHAYRVHRRFLCALGETRAPLYAAVQCSRTTCPIEIWIRGSERSGEAVEFAMLVWFAGEAENDVCQGACAGLTRRYLCMLNTIAFNTNSAYQVFLDRMTGLTTSGRMWLYFLLDTLYDTKGRTSIASASMHPACIQIRVFETVQRAPKSRSVRRLYRDEWLLSWVKNTHYLSSVLCPFDPLVIIFATLLVLDSIIEYLLGFRLPRR